MIPLTSIPKQNRLADSNQSRELDQLTINEFGIDGFTLMEIAANGAATHIKKMEGANRKGLYLCGKGNNAGDALAVARYLANDAAHSVSILFLLGNQDLSPDAEKNLKLLRKLKSNGSNISFLENSDEAFSEEYDYIVDGIFGTGLNSDLRDPLPDFINRINAINKTVYSMDVPSGLNADSGFRQGACIQSDFTFTFGTNKQGLYMNAGPDLSGMVFFINLPFPGYLHQSKTVLIDETLVETLPEISRTARHKYESGVVHILAGSEGLTGAAVMAAKSAWKQGAGAVFLYAPKKLLPVYESLLPQIIKVGVGDDKDAFFKPSHTKKIVNSLENKPGFLLAGPGMGTGQETGAFLNSILNTFKGPVLLDADALSFWHSISKLPADQKKEWVLTPHIGEAANYFGAEFNGDYSRLEWSREFVKEHGCSLLLKGHPAFLCTSDGSAYITRYNTSAFARAGFGDVLSGAIAALAGISENISLAVIKSLWDGYQKLCKHPIHHSTFGPENLL